MAAHLRALSAFALLLGVGTDAFAATDNPCATATSKAVLVEKDEPGEPLRVRGVVYRPDGTTPAPGVIVYVYQTDITGLYSKKRGDPPRLQAWMRTDEKGRYEFLTIRPGPYPNRTEPAHIHTQIWGDAAPTHSNVTLLFADDPLLRPKDRAESDALGRFGFIQAPVKGADGVWQVTLDMRIQERGDVFEESIMHGVRPCGVTPPMRPS